MRIVENIVIAVLLHLFLFTIPFEAHIISLKLQSDNRHIIPFSDFEFSNAGYVSFVISSVTVISTSTASSRPDPSSIGFFQQQPFEFQQNTTICPLDFKLNSVLFTFQNLSHDPQVSFTKSFSVTYSGMKSLFFVNCNNESLVTMDGRAELYNMDDDGTTKNYLSAGLTQLPFLNFFLSSIYLSFTGVWILVRFTYKRYFHRTHLLMGGLLVMSFVQFMCVAADLHYVKVTGTCHGLDVLFCIFQVIRSVLLLTVIVLIGAGWLFWKPFLKRREKLVLMIVILLEIWANLGPVLPWAATVPYNKQDWSVVDIICCFAIFFPIAGSVIAVQEMFETDLYADRNFINLLSFAVLVFVYVVITRPVVLGLSSRWANYVVKETTTLVFCMVMFYIFRPIDRTKMVLPSSKQPISSFHSPV